ncbi:hypothetical protein AGABI2DRAFT_146706 [Agaricus bisporus var. bisporus H97]|uniref:hypothetical protein n=1 Tax=Agaricus bisporus var. bisporus (strain H97 / ATCC MYA-4626 / FGSC 10389) TaxID=936046 RepID=UPI00029F7291|nr:hypothetical protein AGABI2DRAFT_146706 [Agaricus bisporus var. bisporus H97]EKV42204.1 hypothetical protein AGABI2DRAFT_146706 [Agaricus bisporus var. bisporus H97]
MSPYDVIKFNMLVLPDMMLLNYHFGFKALDHTGRGYVINTNDWKEIGARTVDSKSTIPSAFGAPIPNIAMQQGQMTSEMYSNWTLFVAPVLLCGRFKQPQYYTHFMRLVELLKMCLEYEIDAEMLDQIDVGFQSWVEDYERLYYAHELDRLSACPLTLHALLRIAWGIRVAGPVWAYWAFPMERHCNTLLPSIRSRRHPYAAINTFVSAMAQLDQIRLRFNLQSELDLSPERLTTLPTYVSDSYSSYQLRSPRRQECIPVHLRDKLYASLATRFEKEKATVQAAISLDEPVIQYGRVSVLGGGDTIVAHDMVRRSEDSRDSSYIKYIQMVDKYAHQRNRAPEYVKRTFFGQLLRIIVLDLPPTPQLGLDTRSTVIYAVVQAVKARIKKLSPESNGYYYQQTGVVEIVDLSTVKSVVGRVQDGNRWFIVDRSSISAPQVD